MNARKSLIAFLITCVPIHYGTAQDFATTNWTAARSANTGWGALPPQQARYDARFQPTSYRVERDPRYFPTAVAPQPLAYNGAVANYADYRYSAQPIVPIGYNAPLAAGGCNHPYQAVAGGVFDPRLAPNPGLAGYPPTPIAAPYYRAPLPKGYYKGDGLFGKDTVYANGQPVRNLFRFLAP